MLSIHWQSSLERPEKTVRDNSDSSLSILTTTDWLSVVHAIFEHVSWPDQIQLNWSGFAFAVNLLCLSSAAERKDAEDGQD